MVAVVESFPPILQGHPSALYRYETVWKNLLSSVSWDESRDGGSLLRDLFM